MANRIELEAILKFIDVKINPGVFNNISRAAAGMPGPVQKLNQNLQQTVGAANNASNAVRGINNQLTAGQRLSQVFLRRMAQFAILLPTFVTLNKSIQGGVKFLFDFDAAIKDIIRTDIGSLSGRFNEIAKSAFALSTAFGTSAVEAANTIKTYVQAGYDLTKANELARLSLLATKASTLDAAQAVEFLLSANKQFGLEGKALSAALDGLVKVEDLTAVEARDVAEAFKTGGNSLAQFGKDINDSIGLISALREQTRKSGSEIGTFFKTLQARIFAAGESRAALEGLGVSVQNLDGTLRPTLDVLNDLKITFDGLTESQQANAAKSIAGVRQFEDLLGTIKSLDRANKISAASANAVGTAQAKEAVDAEKLNRRFNDLIVAGQKLAFALGEAGGTDFFKNSLKTITSMVDGLTKLVDLLDKIKVPVLPILAPLALKAVGSVFGFGGGPGGAGGGKGGGGGGGGGGGALGGAAAQNVANMRQLSTAISQLTQQMRILMQATMTQSQLTQSNIAMDELRLRANSLNVQATNQMTSIWKGTAGKNPKFQPSVSENVPTFQKFGRAMGGAVGSINKMENAGAKFAVKYALLTLGTTAVTAGLNSVADKLGGNNSFGGVLAGLTGSSVQLAGQFAALGPEAALAAGAFGLFADIFTKYSEEFENNKKAFKIEAEESSKTRRFSAAPEFFKGKDNLQSKMFLEDLGKGINQRHKEQINQDKILGESFKSLDGATKTSIQSFSELKELMARHEIAKPLIGALIRVDSAAFKNVDALEELKSKLDENGKTTEKFSVIQDLFYRSLGMLADETNAANEAVKTIVKSFADLKSLQELIGAAQGVSELQHQIELAQKAPEAMLRGIDLIADEAKTSAVQLEAATLAFNRFNEASKAFGGGAFYNMQDALSFMSDLQDLMSKPNNHVAIDKFLSDKDLTAEQVKFGKDYVKIHEDMSEAVLKAAQGEQSYKDEIYKNNLNELKAQQEVAFKAADALGQFRSQLTNFGVDASNMQSGDTGLLKQLTSLKSNDISNVLSGTSNLPQMVQDIINNSFVDPVKKAETDLSQIGEGLKKSLQPVSYEIESLKNDIIALGKVTPNTSRAVEKFKLEQALTAKVLERKNIKDAATIKTIQTVIKLTEGQKKAQEDAARAEAERLKKTETLTKATYDFARSIHDVNKSFDEFSKQKIEDLGQKQATSYEQVKSAEQGVLSATQALSSTYKDYISTIIQVNGIIAEAKVKSNLLGRDIGMLNGGIVTFKDKLGALNHAFTSVLDHANMKLEQRIQLERQLAEQTLSFLKEAQDQIVSAGINVFGQSAQENQGLQKGIAGLSYVAEKLGGSFKNFLGMNPQQIGDLSKSLLNLPVDFRKSILDALSFLPSTTSIGGFSADQLKQAIGQIGAGVSPEQGLPAISDLTTQQVEQLKILGQLGTQEAKMQLTQVIAAQKAVEKAQEQLDVAKIQEERSRTDFELVRLAINQEMSVLAQANIERRDLLQKVIEADNTNTLESINKQAQLFADQNLKFEAIGGQIVAGIASAINAKMAANEAQTSVNNFNTMQGFEGHAKGYIPNFAAGNLSPSEAAGLLHAASREKRAMPHGANLAIANTHEAIIPMYKNFAGGNAQGSEIAAGISSIRAIDQTMVAAISRSVTNSLSQLSGKGGDAQALDKIAGLLIDLNTSVGQVRDSNIAIKTNTAGLTTTTKTTGAVATGGQEVKITLQTNQNNTVQITGLENLRDQLKQALAETTNKQVAHQIEALMVQLDPVFQALNERGIINSFGNSR